MLALPSELVIEILKELEWKDVLRARQTCKLLHIASQSKSIWEIFLDRDMHRLSIPGLFPLQKPIELYTSSELERAFLRWKGVDHAWNIEDARPTRRLKFSRPWSQSSLYIPTGGRWILCHCEGTLEYADLDAAEPTFATLIKVTPPWRTMTVNRRFSVDELEISSLFSFNIALSCQRKQPRASQDSTTGEVSSVTIEIWQVSVHINDRNEAVHLQAQRIRAFPSKRQDTFVEGLSLLGNHLASIVWSPSTGPMCITIYDWSSTTPRSGYFLIRVGSFQAMCLLPHNRILVVDTFFRIFDYSDVLENNGQTSGQSGTTLLWQKIAGPFPNIRLSRVFSGPKVHRIVYSSPIGVVGITLKDNKEFDINLVPLLHIPLTPNFGNNYSHPHLSYNHGVSWCTERHRFLFMRYAWPEQRGLFPTGLTYKAILHHDGHRDWAPGSSVVHMDPTSGRIGYFFFWQPYEIIQMIECSGYGA